MKSESVKKWTKRGIALAVVTAAAGEFFGLPSTGILRIQPAATIAFLVVLAVAPLFGRLFCECLCPLGALQGFVNWLTHPRTHVRRVCTRLPQSRAQAAVRWTVLAVFAALVLSGFGAVAWSVTPYSIFGKAMALFIPGVALFAAVLVLAAVGKGRFWCNWICPAGTLFTALSAKSVCRHKVGEGCANCRACFKKAESAPKAEDGGSGVTRREAIGGVAVLAAAEAVEKTTDGGFADVSLPLVPKRPATVMPPGALTRARFASKCVGCGRCVKACPSGALRQSVALKSFGQPELFFQTDFCRTTCGWKCAKACPAGALEVPSDGVSKRNFHVGLARVERDLCIRTTDSVECIACSRKCPKNAITIVDGYPSVDAGLCIGCGACEHVCAARPEPAIRVHGLDTQLAVATRSDEELLPEMKAMLDAGASCVVARDGVVAASEKGRGVGPILKMYDNGRLAGAFVADKVIGRAAAAVCALGKVRRVHASLMSKDGAAFLKQHCIEASADEFVDQVLNRDKSGRCPLEMSVEGCENPAEMVKRIREKTAELRAAAAKGAAN